MSKEKLIIVRELARSLRKLMEEVTSNKTKDALNKRGEEIVKRLQPLFTGWWESVENLRAEIQLEEIPGLQLMAEGALVRFFLCNVPDMLEIIRHRKEIILENLIDYNDFFLNQCEKELVEYTNFVYEVDTCIKSLLKSEILVPSVGQARAILRWMWSGITSFCAWLWNGIKSFFKWLWGCIRGFWDWLCSFFRSSPSRRTAYQPLESIDEEEVVNARIQVPALEARSAICREIKDFYDPSKFTAAPLPNNIAVSDMLSSCLQVFPARPCTKATPHCKAGDKCCVCRVSLMQICPHTFDLYNSSSHTETCAILMYQCQHGICFNCSKTIKEEAMNRCPQCRKPARLRLS